MSKIKDSSIMLYSITFYREDEDTGEQIHYDYDGDCSWICDDIDESQLVEIKPKPDPEPTTYNSSAIENLEYIEDVVFQLINGNKDDIDRDDIYTSIAWLAEELGYIYKNGGYMRKEDYLKIMKENK